MTLAVFTTGDTGPTLSGKVPASLVGATSLEAHIRWADKTVLSKPAQADDAPAGTWIAEDWAPGDLAVEGDAEVELTVVFANGQDQTFGPAPIHVRKRFA